MPSVSPLAHPLAAGGAALVVSLLLSLYLTPLFRDSARRFGIVDRPEDMIKRWHQLGFVVKDGARFVESERKDQN